MPYSKMLMKLVAESGYSYKNIIDECNNRGRKIDKAYLSKLLNNKVPAPSEEISKIFASIFNVDERLLVLEGYLDKAPKEIREIFVSMKMNMSIMTLAMLENSFDNDILEQLKREIDREPISDFIIQYTDNQNSFLNIKNNLPELSIKENNVTLNIAEPISLPIQDNAMSPIIPEGSKVILKVEDKYNNGDLLVLKLIDKDYFIARYVLFNNDDIILTSVKKEFKPLTYKKENVKILGKVSKVITDL